MATKNGTIRREGKVVIVESGEEKKIFERKKIFLPGEYDLAIASCISGTNVFVLGMNGYSNLSEDKCRAYGIVPGAYEVACAALFSEIVKRLRNEYDGIDIRLVHGASNMGVDKSAINVGLKLNIPQLGFSCPNYMMYVEDDDIPVYVAKNEAEYCEAFTDALNVLITCNGRKVTFSMDIDAMFKKYKDVIPINIIQAISSTGGPPAMNEKGEIEDAVAFWYFKMHHVAMKMGITGADNWPQAKEQVGNIVSDICRRTMPPHVAFGFSPLAKVW